MDGAITWHELITSDVRVVEDVDGAVEAAKAEGPEHGPGSRAPG
ncbi:MAG: hypothetical protein ACM3QU_14850 [Verrucomicrobiota bacterium]